MNLIPILNSMQSPVMPSCTSASLGQESSLQSELVSTCTSLIPDQTPTLPAQGIPHTSVKSFASNISHPWNDIPLHLSQVHSSIECNHTLQCIIREPRPPPFPSITFLINEDSKYHQHMMQWSKKEFAGCGKCFSVDNENYGCRDCVWLKWWYKCHGETHGFPDIEAWTYKKYL